MDNEVINKINKEVKIYDNCGKTLDRFTAVFVKRPERRVYGQPATFEALGFSGNPFHPWGYGQHCSAAVGRHLGKRTTFEALPEKAQTFLAERI